MKQYTVTLRPEGRSLTVDAGAVLTEAALQAERPAEAICAGRGTCGKCRVKVRGDAGPLTQPEYDLLGAEEIAQGVRLGCQAKVHGDLEFEVLAPLVRVHPRILSDAAEVAYTIEPSIHKVTVTLNPTEGGHADLDVIRSAVTQAVGGTELVVPLAVARMLPDKLRQAGKLATAVVALGAAPAGAASPPRLIDVEPGDTTAHRYGIAIDLGTTTVAAWLLDLATGRELARASALNPQVIYGGDVISRLSHALETQKGLRELHRDIVQAFNLLIAEMCRSAGIAAEQVYEMTVAANSTMQHFLLNVSPRGLGAAPFRPAFQEAPLALAYELGVKINPGAEIHVMPNIAGYVGGDTVAAVLGTELDRGDKTRVLVDLGTNGEIVAGNQHRLIACSTAAGPAFEGAKISQGMRGEKGAIERVTIDDQVRIQVIGDAPPIGICGSGLIDAAAEMGRAGVMDNTGRIKHPEEALEDGVPPAVAARCVEGDAETFNFVLAPGEITPSGKPVMLTQKDIRELQSAKAAILAGAQLAVKALDLDESQVDEVILAGAFGTYLKAENAAAIGLIPLLPTERIRSAGNAAGLGARMALLSRTERRRALDLARRIEHLDLANHPDFVEYFLAAHYFFT